ncbi:MAG TPA: hypothetical protein VKA21_16995 [Candidatus Binatia bacterium]|nr:hypothetical protein [Candidatus Binatia bacterium]
MNRVLSSPSRSLVVVAFLVATGCALITGYDPTSYKNATDLKVESLALIDKAGDPASQHTAAIEQVRTRLLQAYEYEKGKKTNNETARQWAIMVAPDRNLMGGFMEKWLREGPQSAAFRSGMKSNVEQGFDTIIDLEEHKVKK